MPAQKSKPRKPRRAPAYSADTMALHLVGGLLLIALGLLIFLSVVTGISGDVFAGMRQVCYGLAGSLAFLLPVFPIWGGALVFYSAYRKPPLRAFLLAALLYFLLLAALHLVSTSGTPAVPLMRYFYNQNLSRGQSPTGFDAYMARSYELGCSLRASGGALGMLLAWPLYQLLGNAVLGGVLCILGAVVDFLFLIRLDVKGILAQLRGRVDERQQRQQREQEQLRQQELIWQQQAAERNYLPPQGDWQQPPAQEYPPQQPYPPQPEPFYPPQPQPRQPVQSDRRQAVGFQPVAEEHDQPVWAQPAQSEQPNKPRKSWIFSHRDDEAEQDSAVQPPRPGHIFPREQPAESQPAYEPAPDMYAPPVTQEAPPAEEPAPVPAEPTPRDSLRPAPVNHRDEALWADDTSSHRKASWRSDEDDVQPSPRPRKAPDALRQPTGPIRTVAAERPAAVQAPANPPRKQQPLPSWSETPPWEDTPQPAAQAVKSPHLQQEPPRDAWQPELKLPPRKAQPEAQQVEMELPPPYVYPGMDLLKAPEPQAGISPEEDAMRSQRLEETLQSFKVPAKVRHVTHGPAISRFELELAAGIKVTKVTDLGKNIAMNMEVKSVRIEAPIPGKALVGVEVPNRKVSTVTLREVLGSQAMAEAKSTLAVALGKDIAGTPIICDLARMPHLLIAGATGSGKSVCINTMINSLLFRCSPREVRLILVDPKVVELQCYNGIPHLLIPVVSDPHKASGALAWAVAEMMDRYKKFERKGVRAIDGYNGKLEDGEEFMPRIVIIIDELADLMMTCKREVEDHICRLAQLARAAGIHLVVATQRPSVDVITGLIKANIPSRIAFKVSSFIDSRTILDRQGAEQLLGWGDMLYMPTGEFTPIRVQGCFMSDNEVNRVTDFIREHSDAEYDPDILEQLDQMEREANPPSADTADATDNISGDASLLAQCIEMAVNDGQVSTSLLQRRLKVGYARAGRLVDEMEKRGIVSAKDGSKPRMCLISREEFEAMQASGELDE